jgi:hypothetical protein
MRELVVKMRIALGNLLKQAKDRFPDVRKRVGSLRAVWETQNFKTKHYILLYRRNMAEILLKQRKTHNQSI